MVRNSKQGVRKCSPGGKKVSRPAGVVPITNFFTSAPKSKSPLSSKSLSQSSPSGHPSHHLLKPLLSDSRSSSHAVNDAAEPLTSENHRQTNSQVFCETSNKAHVQGRVQLVLNRLPLIKKRKHAVSLGKKDDSEHEHRNPSKPSQNRTVAVTDCPAVVSNSETDLSVPSSKRQCLVDLTHSPATVTEMDQTSSVSTNVSGEKRSAGDSVTSNACHAVTVSVLHNTESVKTSVSAPTCLNATTKAKKALFMDDGVQCTTLECGNEISMDVQAQNCSHNDMSSEEDDSQGSMTPQQSSSSLEKSKSSKNEPHDSGTNLQLSSGESGHVLSFSAEGRNTVCLTCIDKGHSTPRNTTLASANKDCTCRSAPIHQSDRVPVVMGEHHQALSDLELVLHQKGVSYFQGKSPPVRLFSSAQESVIGNLLDFNSRNHSQKLSSIVRYLKVATTPVTMPKAHTLEKLWELITDPINCSNAENAPVLHEILCWLHHLLLLHPPGQCHAVDQQYALFIASLSSSAAGSLFGLWEHIASLLSGTECCIDFFSLLVDLLLADYWAFLDSSRKTEPLYVRLFWLNSEQRHLTTPIRKLLEMVSLLLLDYNGSKIHSIKLSNLMILVYLASTRCHDLTTELLLVAQKLSTDKLLLLFSHLHPISLSKHIADNVPQLKETFARFAVLFVPDSETSRKINPPLSNSPPNSTATSLSSLKPPDISFNQQTCVSNKQKKTVPPRSVETQTLSRSTEIPQSVSSLVDSHGDRQCSACTAHPQTSKPAGVLTSGSCSNLLNQQPLANSNYQEEHGKKKGTPSFITSVKPNVIPKAHGPQFLIEVMEHKSVAVVQLAQKCENCVDRSCPRCIN